jgi:hypothetical protein
MQTKLLYITLLLSLLIFACKKDTEEAPNLPTPKEEDKLVYIANEGNFQWGNASITRFNATSEEVSNNLFSSLVGFPLGDVAQSMTIIGDKLYIVVNNSGKVEIVHKRDFEHLGTIQGLNSPRYLIQLNENTAYLSDLYDNTINVINLQTNTVNSHIPIQGWTEEMIVLNETVYVTNRHQPYLYLIENNNIADSIAIQKWASSIVADKDGMIWVYSSGSQSEGLNAKLYRINPATNEVSNTYTFSSSGGGSLKINAKKDQLYFLKNGVYRMNISDTSLPQSPLIQEESKLFYGLGISPDGEIYVSDAKDYVQKGSVYIYSQQGQLLNSFEAGIIPDSFEFVW